MKVAIVGRRNSGKSTFVNTLAQAERMIVSEVPGTTRDSVDVRFELDGKAFIAIDTPGLRGRKSMPTDIDFYSIAPRPAEHSPGRRGAAVLRRARSGSARSTSSSATTSPSSTSRASSSSTSGTCWSSTMPTGKVGRPTCATRFRTMWYVPIAFITGQTGKNVKALLNHAQMLFKQSRTRVGTGGAEQAGARRRWSSNPPPLHPEPPAEDLLRHAGRRAAADDRAVLQRSARRFRADYQRYLLGVFRDQLQLRRGADQALPASPG